MEVRLTWKKFHWDHYIWQELIWAQLSGVLPEDRLNNRDGIYQSMLNSPIPFSSVLFLELMFSKRKVFALYFFKVKQAVSFCTYNFPRDAVFFKWKWRVSQNQKDDYTRWTAYDMVPFWLLMWEICTGIQCKNTRRSNIC